MPIDPAYTGLAQPPAPMTTLDQLSSIRSRGFNNALAQMEMDRVKGAGAGLAASIGPDNNVDPALLAAAAKSANPAAVVDILSQGNATIAAQQAINTRSWGSLGNSLDALLASGNPITPEALNSALSLATANGTLPAVTGAVTRYTNEQGLPADELRDRVTQIRNQAVGASSDLVEAMDPASGQVSMVSRNTAIARNYQIIGPAPAGAGGGAGGAAGGGAPPPSAGSVAPVPSVAPAPPAPAPPPSPKGVPQPAADTDKNKVNINAGGAGGAPAPAPARAVPAPASATPVPASATPTTPAEASAAAGDVGAAPVQPAPPARGPLLADIGYAAHATQKQASDASLALAADASGAPQRVADYQTMAALAHGFKGGVAADDIRKIMSAVREISGVQFNDYLGNDPQVAQEEFKKMYMLVAQKQSQQMGGTDAQLEVAMGAVPNPAMASQSIEGMLAQLAGNERMKTVKNNEFQKYIRGNPSGATQYFNWERNIFNKNLDPRVFAVEDFSPTDFQRMLGARRAGVDKNGKTIWQSLYPEDKGGPPSPQHQRDIDRFGERWQAAINKGWVPPPAGGIVARESQPNATQPPPAQVTAPPPPPAPVPAPTPARTPVQTIPTGKGAGRIPVQPVVNPVNALVPNIRPPATRPDLGSITPGFGG